jgi:hypothetical protein
MNLSRRRLFGLAAGGVAASAVRPALAQMASPMPSSQDMQVVQRGGLYANLKDPNITELPPDAFTQRFTYSPAPTADPAGRWTAGPPLPIPRSEMAWAAAEGNRMHVIGGYAEGEVARPFHHVFDASTNTWRQAAPIPRGANHIGVAAAGGVVFAFGGFVEQNRVAVPDCYAYVVADDRWHAIRPLQRGSRGAISAVQRWLSMGRFMRSAAAIPAPSIGMTSTIRKPTRGRAWRLFRGRAIMPLPSRFPGCSRWPGDGWIPSISTPFGPRQRRLSGQDVLHGR